MEFWKDFWGVISLFFWAYVFFAYLIALFSIVTDIVRDRSLNGWFKALWIIFLVWIPFLTALVYLIARGRGMAERHHAHAVRSRDVMEDYIRSVASASPADEIAKAKALLESGVISEEEFAALKRRVLQL